MRTTPVAASPLPLEGGAACGSAEPGRGGCWKAAARDWSSIEPCETAEPGRGGCLKAASRAAEVA